MNKLLWAVAVALNFLDGWFTNPHGGDKVYLQLKQGIYFFMFSASKPKNVLIKLCRN